jgi:hypothetical protein
MVLRPKSPNSLKKRIGYASSTVSTCFTIVLDHPITNSLQCLCLTWLTIVLTWSTRSNSSYILLLVDVYHPPTVSLPILVPWFKPHVHPSLLSVRLHDTSLPFSMAIDRLCAPHLQTNTAKRHVAHTITS